MAGLWLMVTWLVAWSALRLCKQAFPDHSLSADILVTTVLTVGIIHLSLVLMGAAGLLNAWAVWPVAVLFAGLSRIVVRRVRERPADTRRRGQCDRSDELGFVASSTTGQIAKPDGYAVWTMVIWWIATSAYAGHVIGNGLLAFPEDWDTLMYHLPFIDFWIQSGSLTTMQSARWSTPATGELIGAWFVLPFSGDFLAPLTNVPIFILLASGVVELTRRLGLSGLWPHLVAIACLATHVTFRQSVDVSNDVAVAAFFLGGLAFTLRYLQSGRVADACLFGICFGLLCGVKYFALGYAAVLLGMWGLLCLFRLSQIWFRRSTESGEHRIADRWREALVPQVMAAALALLFGGYWYLRNWWMTGYPLYPKGSPDMSERILYEDLSNTTILGNGDPAVPDLLIEAVWKMAGPLHLAAMAAIPAVMISASLMLLFAFRHRKIDEQRATDFRSRSAQFVLIVGVIGCGCVWVITPMLVEDQPGTLNHLRWGYGPVRYGLTFLSMSLITMFVVGQGLVRKLPVRANTIIALVVGGVVVLQVGMLATRVVRFDLIAAGLIGANFGLASLMIRVVSSRFRRFEVAKNVLALFLVPGAVFLFSQHWHEGFDEHFNRYDNTNAHSQLNDKSHRIIVLSNRVYPFFGSQRQNHVLQPMLYYGKDAVAASCEAFGADLVVTRVDNHKSLARYRASWDDLAADPRFDEIETGSERLKLFRYYADFNVAKSAEFSQTISSEQKRAN
ncbi:hypothetical protein [Allorhodopirellula solitaria]|nr:hypothetical protein [Allorhodopirellula solitaria]